MTELQMFTAMLSRAGVGHGLRYDYNPPGTSVQVEHEESDPFYISDWSFDAEGKLISTTAYEHEEG